MIGPTPARLLLVDDQTLFVESLKYVLEARAEDIHVVGIGKDGQEAIRLAQRLNPDIILMDVRMPELDGVQATRIIAEMNPKIKIVMLTTFQNDDYVTTAIKFGAIGYLLKNIPPMELIASIRAVKAGSMQLSPDVARRLAERGSSQEELKDERPFVMESLPKREKEVLRLIAKAYDNKQIAEFLGVTEQTTRNYVHNLYTRLGVSNRMQLLRIIAEFGID